MKQQTIVLFFFVVIIALAIFAYRRRTVTTETYVLPDFNLVGATSNICPEGYILVCVSSNLYGITNTIPFPASLPKPCADDTFPSTPLCIPHPRNIRPPIIDYRPGGALNK